MTPTETSDCNSDARRAKAKTRGWASKTAESLNRLDERTVQTNVTA